MTNRFSIEVENGVNLLIGPIDEYTDLSPLANHPPPLRISLGGITKINSIGIAKWLKLMKEWDGKPIEYHNVSHTMVSSANIMPMFFNLKDPTKKIRSMLIPYFCENCDEPHEVFCNDFEIIFKQHSVTLPKKLCQKCGKVLDMDVGDDYFLEMITFNFIQTLRNRIQNTLSPFLNDMVFKNNSNTPCLMVDSFDFCI